MRFWTKKFAFESSVRQVYYRPVSVTQGDNVSVQIEIKNPIGVQSENSNDVYVAVSENNLDSHVRGGENGGRHLSHTAVVRSLRRIGSAKPGIPFDAAFNLKLEPNWKKQDLSIVAFIQARTSKRILGVGIATPSS